MIDPDAFNRQWSFHDSRLVGISYDAKRRLLRLHLEGLDAGPKGIESDEDAPVQLVFKEAVPCLLDLPGERTIVGDVTVISGDGASRIAITLISPRIGRIELEASECEILIGEAAEGAFRECFQLPWPPELIR